MNATASRPRPMAIEPIAPAPPLDRPIPGPEIPAERAISLAEMGRIVLENDILLDALDSVATRIAETRHYLDTPGTRTHLAIAYLARMKARKSHLLGRLRANKILSDAWLADNSPAPADA